MWRVLRELTGRARSRSQGALTVTLVIVIGIAAGAAAQDPGVSSESAIQKLPPVRDHRFDDIDALYPVAADPESATIAIGYAVRSTINVWSVVVYYWPETFGLVTVLAMICWLRRLARRKPIVGQVHCRRCFYCLIDHRSERCPECGAELTYRNRVIGRPRRWPIATALSVLIACVAGYFVFRSKLPRQGSVSSTMTWDAAWLARWANDHDQVWLRRHLSTRHRIVRINVMSGERRTVVELGPSKMWHCEFTGDMEGAIVRQPASISIVDLGDEPQVRTVRIEDMPWLSHRKDLSFFNWMVAGRGAEDLYVAEAEGVYATVQLWDFKHMAMGMVLDAGRSSPRLYYLKTQHRLAIVDESTESGGWRWRELDLRRRQVVQTFESLTGADLDRLEISPDEHFVLIAERQNSTVEMWDRIAGTLESKVERPTSDALPTAVTVGNRWLLTRTWHDPFASPTATDAAHAIDLRSGKVVADLTTGLVQIRQIVGLSDGHTIVITGDDPDGSAHLVVFDLNALSPE